MNINKKKRLLALLAAALLFALLCGAAVCADEAEPETAAEETFFDELKAGNGFGTTLFVAGLGFTAVGAVGIVCLIFWQKASKRRDREEEDREEIFDEIKQAELRNKKKREYEHRAVQREKQDTAELPEISGEAQYAQVRQERPIVPTTPVSMQPNEVRRPRTAQPKPSAQPAAKPVLEPVRPKPAKPAAPAAPAVKPAVKPAEKPVQKPKYDLDDILREVRESKVKNRE